MRLNRSAILSCGLVMKGQVIFTFISQVASRFTSVGIKESTCPTLVLSCYLNPCLVVKLSVTVFGISFWSCPTNQGNSAQSYLYPLPPFSWLGLLQTLAAHCYYICRSWEGRIIPKRIYPCCPSSPSRTFRDPSLSHVAGPMLSLVWLERFYFARFQIPGIEQATDGEKF
jgi:hypothetical protein